MQGKVAWRSPEERGSAALSWYQQQQDYLLLLTGPLGRGAVELRGDAGGVTLTTDDRLYAATTPEVLLYDLLGLQLPVGPARWWVRGQLAPGEGGVTRWDEARRPLEISQRGWIIRYDDWTEVDGFVLPARLEMLRDDVSLRFIIGRWNTGAASVESILGPAAGSGALEVTIDG